MDEFPPNTQRTKPNPAEKQVEQVIAGSAKRRKKSVGKQFRETFFSGDGRTATEYIIFGVLVPATKEAIADAGREWINSLMFGQAGRRGPAAGYRPPSGTDGPVPYSHFSMASRQTQATEPTRMMSRRGRERHDFDEIVLETRGEAQQVIDSLLTILSGYESVTVADLYRLVGIPSKHTVHAWGWRDLRGAGVSRDRGGHLLDLPEPEPLN